MRHLLSIAALGPESSEAILQRAAELAEAGTEESASRNFTLGLLFFQPSTRTRIGFTIAATRLGGAAVVVEGTKHQAGMYAPESISDTARVLGGYCDALVMRHSDLEAVEEAANASPVPLICGGAGQLHHPTQTLIDLFAIRRRLGKLHSLRIGIAGDILTSRTGHSLLTALAWYSPTEVRLIAPPERGPRGRLLESFGPEVVTWRQERLAVEGLDVLYMAGMPPGVGPDRLPEEVCARFRLTAKITAKLPDRAIVLCALPRTGDIDPEVDVDPRAWYFRQSDDGLFVRMAVLEHVLGA